LAGEDSSGPANSALWPLAIATVAALADLGEGLVENAELDVFPQEVMRASELLDEFSNAVDQPSFAAAVGTFFAPISEKRAARAGELGRLKS
jgi:hypothetical protein